MTAAARSNAAPSGAALVLDVEALLAKLPAAARAQVAWVKAPILEGVRRLQTEAFSDALLDEVVAATLRPLAALGRTFAELMAVNRDLLRASIMEDFERDRTRLQAYVDADAADTAAWGLGFLRSFYDAVLTYVGPSQVPTLHDDEVEHAFDIKPFRTLMRGQVALMAALEGVKAEAPSSKVAELLDIAFLQLIDVRDHLRQQGLWISAFPDETSEERRQDALRYAERLREIFSDDDWGSFGEARLGDLR
jgi:hypothetical protein